MDILLYTYSL